MIVAHDVVESVVQPNTKVNGSYQLLPNGRLNLDDELQHRDHGTGTTPVLFLAALQGDVAVIRKLLQAGSDVNAVDRHGQTALMVVAWSGRADCIRELLRYKADVNLRDKQGYTALKWAKTERHTAAQLLLEKAGAKE